VLAHEGREQDILMEGRVMQYHSMLMHNTDNHLFPLSNNKYGL